MIDRLAQDCSAIAARVILLVSNTSAPSSSSLGQGEHNMLVAFAIAAPNHPGWRSTSVLLGRPDHSHDRRKQRILSSMIDGSSYSSSRRKRSDRIFSLRRTMAKAWHPRTSYIATREASMSGALGASAHRSLGATSPCRSCACDGEQRVCVGFSSSRLSRGEAPWGVEEAAAGKRLSSISNATIRRRPALRVLR